MINCISTTSTIGLQVEKKKTLEMQFGELEGVVSFTTVLSQAECSSPWLQEVVESPFNEPAIIEVT